MWTNWLPFLRSANQKLLPPAAMAAGCYLFRDDNKKDTTLPNKNKNPARGGSGQTGGGDAVIDSFFFFFLHPLNRVQCDANHRYESRKYSAAEDDLQKYIRKRDTLRQAADDDDPEDANGTPPPRRFNTRQELNKLRSTEKEMLSRWERDEEGWRELPARAWPAFQPTVEQMEEIRETANAKGCFAPGRKPSIFRTECQELQFQIATTLVFYNVDPKEGLEQFKELANLGHVDSMVACGVILVEGLGVLPNETEGISWLRRAAGQGSSQAYYELGTIYYTGIADVLEEDPALAYSLFERAATSNHVAATYMMADCLAEGEGVARNVGRAVPLFYKAAEQGHRFARQRIRELLAHPEYKARNKPIIAGFSE